MMSTLAFLCGLLASASAFYEPADNIKARPYYKSPPHVTEYEYHPHPVYKTQASDEPQAPAFKPEPEHALSEHAPMPFYKPTQNIPVPDHKPDEHVPAPVHEPLENAPLPLYKPIEHGQEPVHEPPVPIYKVPEYEPAPAKPSDALPAYHKHATSFQNVAYKLTQQAYRQPEHINASYS